jgi:hypothetical protein
MELIAVEEFVFFCTRYGMLIIDELTVPVESKTVPPCSLGGVAGGAKYIVNGILFK